MEVENWLLTVHFTCGWERPGCIEFSATASVER